MAQVAIQHSAVDFGALAPPLREDHAHFLARHRDVLVTFGPVRYADGTPVGYAYQTDYPGTDAEAITGLLADDPFAKAGLYVSSTVSGWNCGLKHRQATMPPRPGFRGFFFYGVARPNATEQRNALIDSHRTLLTPKDNTHCLARGGLTDKNGTAWLGSAMIYEFPDREALEDFLRDEPFLKGGIYQRVDIYDWERGRIAA